MRRRNRPVKSTKIEIIPMIDTMFFLLVFFLLSALNVINLESIGLNLPKENSDPKNIVKKVNAELTVAITNSGLTYVNKRPVSIPEVGPALVEAATATARTETKNPNAVLSEEAIRNLSIVISAENRVKHGTVVSVIDSARQVKIERFAIAVDQAVAPAPSGSPAP